MFLLFSVGNTSCPPEWKELSPMECYKIMTNPTDGLIWSTAQEYCGYSISNLIVIPTEAIFTVIQGKKSQHRLSSVNQDVIYMSIINVK